LSRILGGKPPGIFLFAGQCKFAFVQLVKKTGRTSAFLEALIATVPHKIHTVLTDNGIQFTFPPRYADGPTARYVTHMFDMRCQENGIEHRLTKIKHPWTNDQVSNGAAGHAAEGQPPDEIAGAGHDETSGAGRES
jgi:hypothetical protein